MILCFLKRLEESIESLRREHMNLINDIDTEFPDLWRYPHLVGKVSYVINTVVRGSVQFVNVKGCLGVE